MDYTLSDFTHDYVSQTKLLAGAGGMARTVREVVLLDYELSPQVKESYQRINFGEHQLVLSTFLYAQHDPRLILDAVKFLVSRGASGLVIKNVLHLPIPEPALRYANARNFPLFTTTDDSFFFDEVIRDVNRAIEHLRTYELLEQDIDSLLAATTPDAARTRALALCPSLRDVFCVCYATFPDADPALFRRCEHAYIHSSLFAPGCLFAPYREGVLMLVSAETPPNPSSLLHTFTASVLHEMDWNICSASLTHFGAQELSSAITEALNAHAIAAHTNARTLTYSSLGMLQALLPHANSNAMQAYETSILQPIREADDENTGQLLSTLQGYLAAEHNVAQAAKLLNQHPNTVRYRLDKIEAITGLSYKIPTHIEQLSLACNIALCREALQYRP